MPTSRGFALGEGDDLVGEDGRPRGAAGVLERLAGLGVDLADGVELVGDVGDGGLVPATLLGDHVHDHRRVVVLRLPQRLLEGSRGRARGPGRCT